MPTRKLFKFAFFLTSSALALAPVAAADSAAVGALLNQAKYWSGKGRQDLARQALNKVLAIDPTNAQARAALAGPVQKPVPTPKPAATPAPPTPTPTRTAQVAQPKATSAPAPRRANGDPGGPARAAGFAALDHDNLDTAASRFQEALRSRSNDPDALGGLGLVRLRAQRFAEARDLLTRASAGGDSSKWGSALAAARFYADLGSAQAALKAGKLDQAEQTARRLAASDFKDHDTANLLLGDILSRQGKNAEAASLYSQAGDAGTQNAALLRAKSAREQALQAVASGDAAGAMQGFQTAIAADPSDPWMRYQYAVFLADQGQAADANAAIAPVAMLNTPDGIYASALYEDHVGQAMNAAARMAQIPADRMTPEMRSFTVNLKMAQALERIHTLQAQGNIDAALAGARGLASGSQASVATLGAVADVLMSLGDSAGAQAAAQQAAQLPLADPGDYQSVVSVLARTGHDIDAATLISRLSPDGRPSPATARLNAILAANQADRLRTAGQNAAAFDLLRNANAPQDRDILGALARLYQGGGMAGQAEQVYGMLLAKKPDDIPSLTGFAEAAAAAHDYDQADAAMDRAIKLAPRNADVYLAASRVAQARGKKGEALRYLKQARAVANGSDQLAANGGFSVANPFTNAPGQSAAPIDPFALSSRPNPAAQSYGVPSNGGGGGGAFRPMGVSFPGAAQSTGVAAPASPFGRAPVASTDPTLARIDREIAAISNDTGPALDAQTSYRNRSGEAGLSKLNQIGATITASTHVGSVKVSATAAPVVLDAGNMTRSGLARFGTNPTAEANGIVNQEVSALTAANAQHDAGIAASLSVEGGPFKADIGTTPMGFQRTNVQGGVSITPKLGDHVTIGIHGERRPVTDSLLSYAGTTDPVTGRDWGSVMRSGGGGSFSYDSNGSGIYVDGAYRSYDGFNVRSNHAFEGNLGAYLNVYRSPNESVTAGANLNYQTYDNNQNYFSYGHGGYFSPQSFVSVAFPLHYQGDHGGWRMSADVSPGYQSYQQDEAAIYPTLPASQAELAALKAQDNDVRATYDSLSKSGFAFAGSATGSYRVSGATRIGGEVKYNGFGVYKEFQTLLSIHQSLSGGDK